MKNIASLLITLSLLFFSCIEEYKIPKSVSDTYEEEIVIQGRILSGDQSIIYVSHTMPMGDNKKPHDITDAKVRIIGENGYQSELAHFDEERKHYVIDTDILPQITSYAIQVETRGEIYQSTFQEIIHTPEIESVHYQEHSDGITIHVTTNNNNDQSPNYMWTYEEDWEFYAPINLQKLYAENKIIGMSWKNVYSELSMNSNPYYYCWKHMESKKIHLYSTKELNENIIKDVELIKIPNTDVRISYIYSILVKQWCLNEEAYNYYLLQKKYSEESDGLFTPMPYEINGNIICTSSPTKKAKGYVLASSIKEKRIFIYASDFKSMQVEYDPICYYITGKEEANINTRWQYTWNQLIKYGAIIYSDDQTLDENDVLYHKECVDCRTLEGSTKKRPDFWPNNHE